MTVGKEIVEKAHSFFDVVGATRPPGGDNLLILGLESTPQRNLDDFGYINGNLQLYGFRNYVQPKLKSLLTFIRSNRFSAADQASIPSSGSATW